jgi:parallel beta-helix repeat protein
VSPVARHVTPTRLVTAALSAPLLLATQVSAPAHASVPTARCSRAGAIHVRPGDDVRQIVSRAGTGRTICFAPGRYRLTAPIRPRAGQHLIASHATLSGSRVLTGFHRTSAGWAIGRQRQQGQRNGTCRSGTACTYPDDVLRDGRPLRRVLSRRALRRGSYYFDYRRNTITVHDDPHHHRVEAMVAPVAIQSRTGRAGANVTVRGFTIEHFATMAQHGAIETWAPGWTIRGNTVRVNHGAGITSDGHVRIIRNRVRRNGQLGIGGTGNATFVYGNDIARNNTGGFDPGWEAGGAKWAVTNHLVVEHNDVHDNNGPGLWTDIDARDTTYADNVVRNNARAGIFHEISGSAIIRGNVVTGNGHGFDTWLWGSGILLAGSHNVHIRGNRLAGNAEGIGLIQQDRGNSEVDGTARTLHDIAISRNVITMSGGNSGGVTDDGFESMFTDPSITWMRDTWHGVHQAAFAWNDTEVTAARWRRLGHDVHGTFTP